MLLVSLSAIAVGGPGRAQSRVPAGPPDAAATLNLARQALDDGRAEEAAAEAGEVLARDPRSRPAADLAVTALVQQGKRAEALAAYDRHVTARGQADPGLLRTVARADLRDASRQDKLHLKVAALEALAEDGEADALPRLQQLAAARPAASLDDLAPLVSLARLGDPAALPSIGRFLESASADTRAEAIFLVGDARLNGLAPTLLRLLDDPEPVVQAAAARVLGRWRAEEAAPRLERLFGSDVPLVRMAAGVALERLGRTTSNGYIADLLQRPIPELQLMALEASQASPSGQWRRVARQLLNHPNEGTRLAAAALTVGADAETTRRVLLAALGSPNPLARNEAARLLERAGMADQQVVRQMLGDSFEPIRVRAAASAVRSAAGR